VLTLFQMEDKLKPAGRYHWDNLAIQVCARGRELNLGSKLTDGHTCLNRFEKLIPKQKRTGITEIADIVLEAMRVKETVEEHHFCGAIDDNSASSAVPEGVNENLDEELGPQLAMCVICLLLLWNAFKQVKSSLSIYTFF